MYVVLAAHRQGKNRCETGPLQQIVRNIPASTRGLLKGPSFHSVIFPILHHGQTLATFCISHRFQCRSAAVAPAKYGSDSNNSLKAMQVRGPALIFEL